MKPELLRVGRGGHPVVIVDGVAPPPAAVTEIAAALAPFPAAGNYYPGLRRVIAPADAAACRYVDSLLEALAPFIGGAFDIDAFDLLEASFSLVTTDPAALAPAQRAPHFDTTDAKHIAILHYLTDTPGTAFYRHRASGIEAVTRDNVSVFTSLAPRESARLTGYVNGSNTAFEEIGRLEGHAGRIAIYQGRLLHSGLITDDVPRDADPLTGRLTANLFIQGR